MPKYLIRIESGPHKLFTATYGDTPTRPFVIANNLWAYRTPWHAAQRLEKLARSWETLGFPVTRIYGNVCDMPTRGDPDNVWYTLQDYQ